MTPRRPAYLGASLFSVLLIAAACGTSVPPSAAPTVAPTAPPTGGTLRVAMDITAYESFQTDADSGANFAWDPQGTWANEPFLLFRCCLLRSLLSYNGHSVRAGGAELRPDLAADLPTISGDGLTWTFRLKAGIHYAPPMADKVVAAGDFVRALERALRPDPLKINEGAYTPYGTYLSDVIAGAPEYSQGTAASITGLETPDDQTLVIHLNQPTGDLGARLALPAAAPIPAGASDGHDTGYGRYLVATGPYMIEGSDQLDPSLPPDQQPMAAGYVPGDHLFLVRNPSWDRATDPLRTAFVDRIEISNDGDYDAVLAGIEANQIDVSISTQLDNADVARLRGDTATAQRVHVAPALSSRYIDMNLAVAPFDDIHVRRAVELATNKKRLVDLMEPGAVPQAHAMPDAFENGLLTDYDPFATPGSTGSVDAAKAEMAQSRYDTNHDGVCDSETCQNINVLVPNGRPENVTAGQDFATDLAGIGLQLNMDSVSFEDAYNFSANAANHAPLAFATGWNSDYFSAADWFAPQAVSTAIGESTGSNLSLIGATAAQLTQYGYPVTSVPSLDNSIAACTGLSGPDAFGCWSSVDQYLMERTVAWVPLANEQASSLTSASVTSFDFDASLAMPSLAQMEVAP